MSVDVSIVVVHWRVPQLLNACLSSIAADTALAGLNVETLVVDNASADAQFDEVMATHSWARTLRLPDNLGFAGGNNAGIARAQGAALLLLNPDTALLPGALRRLWDALWLAPHIGMVAPLLLNPDGSLQSHGYRFPTVLSMALDLFPAHPRLVASPLNGRMPLGDGATPIAIDYPLGAAMLVRRAVIEEVGPLDESYGMYSEEVDWAQRMRVAGWTIVLAPAARVVHHGAQSTRQQPVAMYEALWRSRARYFERWGSARQRRVLPWVVRAGLSRADRHADAERSAANQRISAAFERASGGQR
jgi:GT2 family glycosyltransferase